MRYKMLNSVTFMSIGHLSVGQAFLQVGDDFRELGSVLKWEEKAFVTASLALKNNHSSQINSLLEVAC